MNKKGQDKFLIYLGLIIVCFAIVISMLFGLFYTIDAGDRGIVLTMGKPSNEIMQPGFHAKIPIIQSVIKTSVRTQTISFDNKQATGGNSEYDSLAAASRDLQDVAIGSVVNYHINEGDVLDIYRKYGTEENYQKNILEPIIRETVKATAAQYTAEELNYKRSNFSDSVGNILSEKFAKFSGLFEKYSVVNFEYSDEFVKAIEQKAVASQLLEKSKIELETAKVQADNRIAQATGEAEAIKIQASAIQNQGGASYVQLQAIGKWNGVLPIVSGGSSVPFINIPAGAAIVSQSPINNTTN